MSVLCLSSDYDIGAVWGMGMGMGMGMGYEYWEGGVVAVSSCKVIM